MSTLTPPKPDAATTAPASLRGSAHVLLRIHRKALWAGSALVALGIGVVVALRVWMASAKELCPDGDTTPCGDAVYQPAYARTSTEVFLADGGTVLLLLAGLVGVFVAGPLIARELESGTFRLAWTQSVSPARWLATRLAVPAVLTVTGLTVLTIAYRWGLWALRGYPYSYRATWHGSGIFPGTGPAVLGYGLLAVAVGALCAVLVRRTVLSMSLTALALGATAFALSSARHLLWPAAFRQSAEAVRLGPGDWAIDMGRLTESGRKLYWEDCYAADPLRDVEACMTDRGAVDYFAEVHPASHYWPLQLVETGILLALAALAVFAAFRVLRRLHG
ncbi:ABC transporter permease [Streptomyces sp. NPDC017448]|uniref:ABC transporter permease n=1 Tax=Streptomyces sp. NPDC017448 TaxID=3364996 RepID=UPI00378F26C5